jgi:hypothetical protein
MTVLLLCEERRTVIPLYITRLAPALSDYRRIGDSQAVIVESILSLFCKL